MRDQLGTTIQMTHEVLGQRLAEAQASMPTRDRPRDRFPATDRFLAATSRHVAAANAVLVPEFAQHLENGRDKARGFTQQSKQLEEALAHTKAKLYGSTYDVKRPWRAVWAELGAAFEEYMVLEEDLVEALPHDEHRNELAERLYRSELRAPTRPHPYIPHRGVSGRVARRVAVQVDRFWDTAEGRMIPEPVRPEPQRDGRLTQYLLADPHIDSAPEEPAAEA
ncbi:hypothetical protein E8D34_01275 [Nocardioides sp. GY 10113]|uniref:hypothetical protein n=1 Tax=Nocardioides sp. GY 10113 TaxID=2569761 RepID=UPI0010A75E2C|nr:hypothetical protein [Nocardioides sp. GY 10113]TIC89160.1 hypothetical protein E8D34_01275 [Nocardioides sp. GY 10113]